MSAVVVVNFDEIAKMISDNINADNIEFSTKRLEDILNVYFPNLIELLKDIKRQNEPKGEQKIRGRRITLNEENTSHIIENNKDILLTGISFNEKLKSDSKWSLYIVGANNSKICIVEDVYNKGCLQHKYFNEYVPVPAGYNLELDISGTADNICWFDIEYLTNLI